MKKSEQNVVLLSIVIHLQELNTDVLQTKWCEVRPVLFETCVLLPDTGKSIDEHPLVFLRKH